MAVARRTKSKYVVDAPRPVGDLRSFIDRLSHGGQSGSVLIGFDFPIGVPLAYARGAGICSFRAFLTELGQGRWPRFYDLAAKASDIGIARPFYPARPGGTSQADLVAGLGVMRMEDLLRVCERKTAHRGHACPLFWTLGGKQVGRAAITGWREILVPGIARFGDAIALWPFDGNVAELVANRKIVFAETYPAEACVHLGMTAPGRGWSKRIHAHRLARKTRIVAYARQLGVTLTRALQDSIADGFGTGKDGEDRFDCVAGVLSMLSVVEGMRAEGTPDSPEVKNIEGWIFGQQSGG